MTRRDVSIPSPLHDPAAAAASIGVLIVDDERAYGTLVEAILGVDLPDVGMIRHATSVQGAVTLAAGVPVGCVILDLSLPDADGLEAIGALRDAGLTAPVLVLTGRGDAGLTAVARAAGAAAVLRKGDEHDGRLAGEVARLLA